MKRIATALLTLAIAATPFAPTFAEPERAADNPGQYCSANDNTVQTPFGPLPVPSRGGCASTVATGHLTRAAIAAQCQSIRENDPGTFNSTEGPYAFGGSLGRCVDILDRYHNSPLP